MTKIVQIAGGPADQEEFYIGPPRELRADESNDMLRLHDGTKPGGWLFPNSDSNDSRYQQKNSELDGFQFGPQLKGFPVRISPSSYRIRVLTVDIDNLTLTNANGQNGNPQFALAPEIISDHTFSGVVTFSQQIVGTGGYIGPTSGTHTGNVVGDVTGDLTGNVEGNLEGNTHGSHTGDVDTRGHSLQLDAGQIPLAALADDALEYILASGLRAGCIVMWAGVIADIPEGFRLCNGLNGTPDLRDKFVAGAGGTLTPGDFGGAGTHTHTGATEAAGGHGHACTIAGHQLIEAEMPAHFHGSGATDRNPTSGTWQAQGEIPASTAESLQEKNTPGQGQSKTTTVGGDGTHTHVGSTADAVGPHTHVVDLGISSNIPPYYSLCFIMKVI